MIYGNLLSIHINEVNLRDNVDQTLFISQRNFIFHLIIFIDALFKAFMV